MIVTPSPSEVVPLLDASLPEIRQALLGGIDFANDIQPEPEDRDRWYWAHSARYQARRALEASSAKAQGWELIAGIPNSGIHVCLGALHVVRVLRSAEGTTPAPGHTRRRREAWQQFRLQFPIDDETDGLPPLDLVLDWTTDDTDALTMHLGMPLGVWTHGKPPILEWRVLLPSTDDLEGLTFEGAADDDVPVLLRVDDTEAEAL
ncbi:MAG: hypothetical protein F4Z31_01860 [Gemmatimonadetes bacterium]|nr:hypothetical protein [Gemmatimonadota bacterium]